MIDFYELLGISEISTKTEIKVAYHTMVKKYHPDINHDEEANQIIRSLNEAKEILLDDQKRKKYDEDLKNIKYSKQFSFEKEETYSVKMKFYKKRYQDISITKWQFFFYYWKYGVHSIFLKIFKSLFVFLNFLLFIGIKGIVFGLIFLLSFMGEFIDYIAGFLMLLAIIALCTLGQDPTPNYLPWIPANVECFCIISIVVFILQLLKHFVLDSSLNLFVLTQNLEDKIFIYILMR